MARYSVKLLANVTAPFRNRGIPLPTFLVKGLPRSTSACRSQRSSPPGGVELGRLIPTIDNAAIDIFVPSSQTSNFLTGHRESWSSAVSILRLDGTELMAFDPAFVVYSPSRFYDPDLLDGIGRTIDLCDTGLDASGQFVDDPQQAGSIVRQARGPECGSIAPSGPSTPRTARVAYDDPRSPFNGCRREVTFATSTVRNAGGTAAVWYTDPYGRVARPGAFSGAVKQYVSATDTTQQGIELAAETIGGDLTNCAIGAGVHAPN